jgi:hypothetical protein
MPQPGKIAKRPRGCFGDPDLVFQPLGLQEPCTDPSTGPRLDYNDMGHHSDVHWCPFVSHLLSLYVPTCPVGPP